MNNNTHHKISHSPKPAQQPGETTPSTPQRNPVHSTLQQNHNTHHSTRRDAPAPAIVQTAGIQAPTLGVSKHIPHKDGSTQMPSQEIHLFTINQGTQMPSQQWEQSPTPEDHDPTQTEATMVFTIASQDTSQKSEIPAVHATGPYTDSLQWGNPIAQYTKRDHVILTHEMATEIHKRTPTVLNGN